MDALIAAGDCDLVDKLVFIERDTSHDVGTTPLVFALLLGRGGLVDASAMERGMMCTRLVGVHTIAVPKTDLRRTYVGQK